MKSVLLSAVLFFSNLALGYEFKDLRYDSKEEILYVTLAYSGGLEEHNFSWNITACEQNAEESQIGVFIEDSGWQDTGTDLLRSTVAIDFSSVQSCLPGYVTVRTAGRKFITRYIAP